jgi:DNA-binding response OmpR family regulator
MTSRLLVADDSITIQKIVDMAFEIEDVEVEGIGNGQEAFDRISEFNPDVVLADVDMPGLDGFELCSKIKGSAKTSSIKVLLLASDFEDFDEQRYRDCGADSHISKPFKSDDIVAMVKSLLEAPSNDENTVLLSADALAAEEGPVELTDSEIIEKLLQEEDVESASGMSEDSDVPEFDEEPSLEELLESVERLSLEGLATSDEAVLVEPPEQPVLDEEEAPALIAEESPVELPEPMPLVAEALQGELSEPLEEIEAPVDLEPEEILEVPSDDDIMDQMIRGIEELKESVLSGESSEQKVETLFCDEDEMDEDELRAVGEMSEFADEPEIFAEVRPGKLDNMDDLDSTFKEIVLGGRGNPPLRQEIERPAELSTLGGVVPEPEDLLESLAPGTFSEVGRRPATPEDIKENLDYISRFTDEDPGVGHAHADFRSRDWGYETENDVFTQSIADEVKRLLHRSLSSSLEKEVSGLSETILKTIREVVREITPEIARRVIREEIEKIKKQGMF